MTFFVSNEIKLHPTDKERAPDFLAAHTGTLVSPPHSPTRREELGPYDSYIFNVEGTSWRKSECDLVISGLGWVSVTGTGKCRIKVTAPRGVAVSQRPALLPFESTSSTARFSGGRIVRKAHSKGKGEKKSYGWRA